MVGKALEAVQHAQVDEVLVFGDAKGATSFGSLQTEDGPLPEVTIDVRRDVVALPYSSGTTGLPKGVMLTHFNLVANMCQMDGVEPVTPDDALIAILPFFHIYGLVPLLNRSLANGATVVVLPRFDLEIFLDTMQRYGVTRAYLVPPIVLALAKQPIVDSYDLSHLQVIISAAAPLGAELAGACAARLGCIVKQAYGMTELSPATHVAPDDSDRPGSIGVVISNTECQVIDLATGAPLGAGQQGEILVRGPQVMKGYLAEPAATAHTVDAAGWVHTGDVGYADADGYFYIVDRVKELIKYKGYQVAPAELEALLVSHPAVVDAAVIGTFDEEAGEIPKAFVVLKVESTSEEILAYVAERVAPYKKVRLLEFVDKVPRSASGKILRRTLIERERLSTLRVVPQ
jgi:acyl-CoA synthetase (AMP-forming)/AMP-acid ligase II